MYNNIIIIAIATEAYVTSATIDLTMAMIQILLLFVCLSAQGEATDNLTFMFITSFGQFGFNASGVVPAADIALEDINNDPNILSGYHLMYDQVRDSQVNAKLYY